MFLTKKFIYSKILLVVMGVGLKAGVEVADVNTLVFDDTTVLFSAVVNKTGVGAVTGVHAR